MTAPPTVSTALPRLRLATLPTPLHRARVHAGLGKRGSGELYLKRDDLTGFAVAGNKIRPLEYLLGAAVADRRDVLVTGGGAGSNFVAAAAVAARVVGVDCELVIWGRPRDSVNLALAQAAGARIRFTGSDDRAQVDERVDALADHLRARGRRPFPVPRGGSTPLGAVGFAAAAAELVEQVDEQLTGPPAVVVLPIGSGGSCAGLLAGLAMSGVSWPVLAVSVSRPVDEVHRRVRDLAGMCAALLDVREPLPPLEIVDARGPGFGKPAPADRHAAEQALHTDALLLDDTYGAKAYRVLIERLPVLAATGPAVYWHTGGTAPALASLPRTGHPDHPVPNTINPGDYS